MARILDQFGNAVDSSQLTREEASPSLAGVRSILSDHPSRGLSPQRLAAILSEAEEGDPTRYLELAEDMEEKDLNYYAQLGTRKRAVTQLQVTVEAASDSADDIANADLVRLALRGFRLRQVLMGMLDGIGKGYSVLEIIWDTTGGKWLPSNIVWRDPRWFAFDPVDGRTLRLREGAELLALTPHKYLVHVHEAKAGLPIRGGLARAAAWAYLFKNYAVKDWVAFADIFGQPYRVGKYHPSSTPTDREKLLRAVSSIGTDAAAIIPEGMVIEFIEAAKSGSIDLYEKLTSFLDDQVTKAVLGQTLTSGVGKGGGSRALGEVHNEVRRDIMRSDKEQIEETINDQLVRPIVAFNRGPRAQYPQIQIGLPDELTTMEKLEWLKIAVPLGLDVEVSVVRDLLGFPEPAAGAVVLRPPALGAPAQAAQARHRLLSLRRSFHSSGADATDAITRAVEDQLDDDGWRPVMEPLVSPISALLDVATSLEDVRARLPELMDAMNDDELVQLLERGMFATHLAGGMEATLDGTRIGEA